MTQDLFLAETRPIDHDDMVDAGIRECLRIGSGKSFITFAGAGSGKTYSLKQALDFLKSQYSADFTRKGKQIAVVTFTNNAADEIKDRIEQSTIPARFRRYLSKYLALELMNSLPVAVGDPSSSLHCRVRHFPENFGDSVCLKSVPKNLR